MNEGKGIENLKKKRLRFKVSKHKKANGHVNWNRNEIIFLYSICILQNKFILFQSDLNHLYSLFLNRKTKKQIASKITTSKEDIEKLTIKIPFELIEHKISIEDNIKSISLFLFDLFKGNDYNVNCSDMLFEPLQRKGSNCVIEMNDTFYTQFRDVTDGVLNYSTLKQYLAGEKNDLIMNIERQGLSTFYDSISNSLPGLNI